MSHLNIFLGTDVFEELTGDILAVDFFAKTLIDKGYFGFDAIGDFDSGESRDIPFLEKHCNILKYPSIKDESDFELALLYAIENNYKQVCVYNLVCGNRLDHLIYNLKLILKYKDKLDIMVKDRYNYGYFLKNSNTIIKNKFKYTSLILLSDIKKLYISKDFKYDYNFLDAKMSSSIFVSNELQNESGVINFESGEIFILFSND